MQQYLNLMKETLEQGVDKSDRTGTGTRSLFARQLRFDLAKGFPLLTTKSVHFKSVVQELLWFLSGNTNNVWLQERGVRIWNEWALDNGELGPVYGKQWRSWECPDGSTIDQIEQLMQLLKNKPDSRRLIVSAWNPADLPDESVSPRENVKKGKAALPPCHTLFQFYVAEGKLSCQLYQRSADYFLGVPFNIASYALLTMMVAQQRELALGEFVITFGDVHLYKNHFSDPNIIEKQLTREPKELPQIRFQRKPESLFSYQFEDILLENYDPYPTIKAPVAI